MTKAELIELLKSVPDDGLIAIASDEEGNSIKHLNDVEPVAVGNPQVYNLEDELISIDSEGSDFPLVWVLWP